MRNLLIERNRPVLLRLAAENTLCAFDFDGTLAPIVDHPDRAGMRAVTRDLLRQLAERYPVVILSGRGRADVAAKLEGIPVSRILGNHGSETEESIPFAPGRIRHWKAILEVRLPKDRGVWVEDKGMSLSVHYRQAARKDEARESIALAVRGLEGSKIVGGKEVVNLIEDESPTKGSALAMERDRLGCDWVLYAGDDENDEDAFALPGNVVPVRIGKSRRSNARYYLPGQGDMDELLRRLITLRPPA